MLPSPSIHLVRGESGKAFVLLKDVMRENSDWKSRRSKELVKAEDLAYHYSKLFDANEVEPTQPYELPAKDSQITLDERRTKLHLKSNKSPGENRKRFRF